MKQKKKVLFICTHNSARSQMAEGMLNHFYGDRYETYSAGITPTQVNPYAIKVMKEIGMDISKHTSKSIEQFRRQSFNVVVTVCDNAQSTCPFFPGAKQYMHKSFDDPSNAQGTEKVVLQHFRRARDEIADWLKETFGKEA